MSRLSIAALAFATLAILPLQASAGTGIAYPDAVGFATLPEGVRFPEGIATNPATGDVFVGTFDFGGPNELVRIGRNGRVEAIRDFGGTPLLGLGFSGNRVYVLNFGASRLQRLPADFDATTPIEDVATFPAIGTPGSRTAGNPDGSQDTITFGSNAFPAPNAMVFDASGNLYVSDSFQGAIYRIDAVAGCAAPCAVTVVKHDPLLATAGFPPFGANGLAFNADGQTLYVANTGDDRVLAMQVAAPNALTVFAESINGADGLLFENGRLWVAANQSDEVVALNAQGRPIIRAGYFAGITREGVPRGLLFPASIALADGWMYVANVALPLTDAVGDEPEEDVQRWTISRIRLQR